MVAWTRVPSTLLSSAMTALLATLTSTLLLASAPALVAGYGSGAPAGSCDTMKPGPPHGENQVAEKDRDPAPFNLEAELQDNGQVKGEARV